MTSKQPNTKSEDNKLILYRLERVEAGVTELGTKLDRQDNIKRSDLKEFQETIVTRFLDMRADLQKQLDDQQKQIDSKPTSGEFQDFKKVVYGIIAFAQSIFLLILGYLITRK